MLVDPVRGASPKMHDSLWSHFLSPIMSFKRTTLGVITAMAPPPPALRLLLCWPDLPWSICEDERGKSIYLESGGGAEKPKER